MNEIIGYITKNWIGILLGAVSLICIVYLLISNQQFLKECYAELKKVTWPSRDDVVSQTTVVVVSIVIVSAVLAVIDFSALQLISKIITLGK